MHLVKYISTRGNIKPIGFKESVMMGLARDGGLLLPEEIPDVSGKLASWKKLSYSDLAYEIMKIFTDLPAKDLRKLVDKSYATFDSKEITPVVSVAGIHIVELFHGPTLAFKDVALQFLGNLFEYILKERRQQLNILAATSGDTGSAAIHGVRGRKRIRIFVMHPQGRVSDIQERQMTSVLDDNVFNIAVDGTFDDCQRIMKAIFNDLRFKDRLSLGSVNSINWARILAQIVYYFYAAFRVMEATKKQSVRFAVPTGNFGDIFAGYVAKRMGLPISKLVLATNENDILSRFFNTGVYSLGKVRATVSPSMDIQVASNFERYLYYKVGEAPTKLRKLMNSFASDGRIAIEMKKGTVDRLFAAGAGDTESTLATIREFHGKYDYLLDPHSAVGVCVGMRYLKRDEPMICLATAHPSKFGKAIEDATGGDIAHHRIIDALKNMPTRCEALPVSVETIREYIESCVKVE
jgi:threonine synthase